MRKRIRHPHAVLRVTRLVAGSFLTLLGLIGLMIPVVPQWPFLIPGLMLLAPESRHIRRLVVWLRARLRLRRWRKGRRKVASRPPSTTASTGGTHVDVSVKVSALTDEESSTAAGRSGGAGHRQEVKR